MQLPRPESERKLRSRLQYHVCTDLLHRRPGDEVLPPRLHVRVQVDERHSNVCLHEVVCVREVGEVREAEEIAGEVLALGQAFLVDLQHFLEFVQALIHDLLVGLHAEPRREHDALVDDGRDGREVVVRLHFRPHVYHRGLRVAFSQQIDVAGLAVFAEHVL
jgi:hypothetical protein